MRMRSRCAGSAVSNISAVKSLNVEQLNVNWGAKIDRYIKVKSCFRPTVEL